MSFRVIQYLNILCSLLLSPPVTEVPQSALYKMVVGGPHLSSRAHLPEMTSSVHISLEMVRCSPNIPSAGMNVQKHLQGGVVHCKLNYGKAVPELCMYVCLYVIFGILFVCTSRLLRQEGIYVQDRVITFQEWAYLPISWGMKAFIIFLVIVRKQPLLGSYGRMDSRNNT